MVTNLILVCIATVIFIVYNAIAVHNFGIPKSLSDTFYYYNEKRNHPEWKLNHLGWFFTAMMTAVAFLLMPAWISITEIITSWSNYLTVLPFLGAGSIIFVGTAPAFRANKMERTVHSVAAKCAAAFSLAWDAIVCYKVCYIILIALLIVAALAHITKTQKTALTYWLEMVAFIATFTTIIVECCILL